MDSLRIDKWLWAARFYKTRSLASDEVNKNRVQINGQDAKPSREVKVGHTVSMRQGPIEKTVVVKAISAVRGPAPVAQLLYEETPESLAKRTREAEQNRLSREPAHSIEHGRPTKRDRRQIEHAWNDRWSASAD
ncbi:RNA-binding S4 domain-containing protein [Limnohabitans sp. B9-3]|uniref:RNA-binding S4 domain-containing protein n=1 Tax=Limnohabitans sp. B9-3 TaxID=1100707 RepID=UPI000C1EB974|nr:RNA-binding S4 domain-containing protein [Limnohabitans sp. B9-3]PIT74491.1 RNA-binding protein [Limnohabitans sp. B9-3]